ncbi:YezD family protein [Treponema primitia]|uniref:YezD family protein n=1 Tax=Treponema primitia TaxID=88058 RepID=UPI00025554CB|nr:YezD family protein [Treponema primitia]
MAEEKETGEFPGGLDDKSLKELNLVLSSLKHGSVTLIIQNGKVVQIEKNEKIRLV